MCKLAKHAEPVSHDSVIDQSFESRTGNLHNYVLLFISRKMYEPM